MRLPQWFTLYLYGAAPSARGRKTIDASNTHLDEFGRRVDDFAPYQPADPAPPSWWYLQGR